MIRMQYILLLPMLYLGAALETSLGGVVRVGRATPDFLALVAIVWLLTVGGPRGFLVAGAIGLFGDLIAPGRVGLGMASFLLVGYALSRLRTKLPLDHLTVRVVVVFIAVTLLSLSTGGGRLLVGEAALAPATLLTRAVGVGAYTAGVSLPVLMVLGWIRPSLAHASGYYARC